MKNHTVVVDRSESPAALRFAPVFNVAVPMIDRHLDEGRSDKVAIRTVRGDVTYGELAEGVNRSGNALIDLGIKVGERVLMVVKDCPEFITLFFGAIKVGIIPVPVNTMMRTTDYRYLIDDSECAALVYSPESAETVEQALSAAGFQPAHVLRTEGAGGFTEHMSNASVALEPLATALSDECFWLYSSGSTGNPKGVVHVHQDIVCTSQRYAVDTLGLNEDDVCFTMSKLFHSYGFGNAMTFPLWIGGSVVLSDRRASPEMVFEIIEQFRPTAFFGVPTLYAQGLKILETAEPDLSSLRLCISAGEALPADVFERWKERTGLSLLDGIGSTENQHIFISNTESDIRPGSTGRAVPGYEIKLVDEDGNPVEQGEIGTVQVKGESAAKSYWKNPEKTASTMLGEWLNTGDMYYQDEDGYYVNCGRGDDMLKVGGLWCSPFEIEAKLIEHPKVLEAAVVGLPDQDGLIKPEAFIVLNDPGGSGDTLEEELRDHCKAGLAHYKYPRAFNFVDDLPKTVTGKIQRFKLRSAD
ncbi:MAG TPA: benzoate-CoA ligase family protein [Rhodospirillales bacterium]|nr:benzoate-CoA ligase family protein [Rhodospirillales bacterium]